MKSKSAEQNRTKEATIKSCKGKEKRKVEKRQMKRRKTTKGRRRMKHSSKGIQVYV